MCARTKWRSRLAAGVKTAKLFIREDQVFSVLVDMGCPAFAPAKIPVKLDGDRVMMRPVFLAGEKREISCVSMGNPHVVIFVEDVNRIPLEQVGPQIETDSLFPERVNVSFAQIVDKNDIVMRVWGARYRRNGGLRHGRVRGGSRGSRKRLLHPPVRTLMCACPAARSSSAIRRTEKSG